MFKDYQLYINDLPDDLEVNGNIALDTEAMGLSHNRDRLCLLQIADQCGKVFLVQFKGNNFSAPNLKKILQDISRQKIFHYGRFDIAIILKYLNVKISNVYCTKIASRLSRTYAAYHSLAELCSDLLSVKISKNSQLSDWGADKLSMQQLSYAANDVIYLHRIKTKLNVLLKRENRFELATKCFDFLPTRVELDARGWIDEDIFSH